MAQTAKAGSPMQSSTRISMAAALNDVSGFYFLTDRRLAMANKKQTDQELLIDDEEAGRLLSLSARAVRALACDGKLPCVRFSRKTVRFSRAALEDFVQKQSKAAAFAG
jgi:excisionase family DNA binding protein